MNVRKCFYACVASIMLAGSFTSCGDDIETPDIPVNPEEQPKEISGFYILNRGSNGENNSSIHFYDYATSQLSADIYQKVNNSSLGESAQQMLIYGSKIYVAVTFSNRLAVLDMDGKLLKTIEPEEGGNTMNPRCLAADGGKVYMTYFNGHAVAALDTVSLEIENKVAVGRYPEELAVANGKLYVANSGGNDFPNYGKTVSVVDLSTFKVEKDIEVIINPVSLQADSKGDVYVISMGNYDDVNNTLQRIDATTGEVKTIGNGSLMKIVNDKLYVVYAQYGKDKPSLTRYDALTGAVEVESLANIEMMQSPSAIGIDPTSGAICIADGPWNSTATLYLFDKEGKQTSTFDAKGYATMSVCYLAK